MPNIIQQTNLPDPPAWFESSLQANVIGGYIQVTENPAEVVLIYGGQGFGQSLEPQLLTPGSYNVGRSPNGTPLWGIRARSATAGVTAVLAGYFWTTADPTLSFVGVPTGGGAGVNSARVRCSVGQALGATATTIVIFDIETFDNGDMWDVGQPTRFTVPPGGDGKYLIGCHGLVNGNGPIPHIRKNGVDLVGVGVMSVTNTQVMATTIWDAIAGDFFEIAMINPLAVGRVITPADNYSFVAWIDRLP